MLLRLRIVVYLRPRTIKALLARKDKQWGGQRWLADQMRVSEVYVSRMLSGNEPVPTGRQSFVINAFRGMSHKKGGRLSWDDVFQQVTKEMSAATGEI